MPARAACDGAARGRRARGFTLIEVLVVLVIVGVLLAALTFSIGGSSSRALQAAAERSRLLIALACERAAIGGRDVGFAPTVDGLRFGYFELDGWREIDDRGSDELRPRPWGDGIVVEAERDGEPLALADVAEDPPAYACLSSGELTPLRLRFVRADVRGHWELEGAIDGALTLREVADAR